MAQQRYYASGAFPTTILSAISSSQTTFQVGSVAGLPASVPFTMLLDWGDATQEAISVTSAPTGSGPWTLPAVTRGIDGTTAQAHEPGAIIVHGVTAQDYGSWDAKPGALETIIYVSKNGADANDGLSWGSAKLTAAAGLAALPNGGRLRFGNGWWLEGGLTLPAGGNIHISGQGSNYTGTSGSPGYTVLFSGYYNGSTANGGGDLFYNPSGNYVNVVFEDIALACYPGGGSGGTLTPSGGHVFNLTGAAVSFWVMHRVALSQSVPGKALWYISGGSMLSCWFHDFTCSVSGGNTMPGWHVFGAGDSQNDNSWENFRYTGNNSCSPAFWLANGDTAGWSQDLTIRGACFEETTGGNVHLEGFRYVTFENHVTYDIAAARSDTGCTTTNASATVLDGSAVSGDLGKPVTGTGIPAGTYIAAVTSGTGYTLSANATASGYPVTLAVGAVCNDMYYIGNTSGTNLACDMFSLSRIDRLSGTLGTGVYDINCHSFYSGKLEQCGGSINFNSDPYIVTVSCDDATYYNRPAGSTDISARSGITSAMLAATGFVGATPASTGARLTGGSSATAGHPTAGTFLAGDIWVDSAGTVWTCTSGGTPGTWTSPSGGGAASNDPLSVGRNQTFTGAPQALAALNVTASTLFATRLWAAGYAMSSIRCRIGTVDTANAISVAVLDNTGTYGPGNLLAYGSATPSAAGDFDITLNVSATPQIGYYVAWYCPSTTMTLYGQNFAFTSSSLISKVGATGTVGTWGGISAISGSSFNGDGYGNNGGVYWWNP
jgi:hypothetical protein